MEQLISGAVSAVIIVVSVVAWRLVFERTWTRRLQRERVVVQLVDGGSLAGVMIDVYKDGIVLAQVSVLDESQGPTQVDGEACIPRENIQWVQRPGSAA